MTGFVALASNLGVYFLYKKLKSQRTKHFKKELNIAFARFSTKTD